MISAHSQLPVHMQTKCVTHATSYVVHIEMDWEGSSNKPVGQSS